MVWRVFDNTSKKSLGIFLKYPFLAKEPMPKGWNTWFVIWRMLLWYNTNPQGRIWLWVSNPRKWLKHRTRDDAAFGRWDLVMCFGQRCSESGYLVHSCPVFLVQGSKVHKWKYSQVYIGTLLNFVLLSLGMFHFGWLHAVSLFAPLLHKKLPFLSRRLVFVHIVWKDGQNWLSLT